MIPWPAYKTQGRHGCKQKCAILECLTAVEDWLISIGKMSEVATHGSGDVQDTVHASALFERIVRREREARATACQTIARMHVRGGTMKFSVPLVEVQRKWRNTIDM